MPEKLIFEIGTEEIPARFLPSSIKQIEEIASEQFQTLSLAYDEIKVFATPRRLTLCVEGLAEKQADSLVESKGPAVKAAYDADGNPTKALMGFCKGQGIETDAVGTKEINGVSYIYIQKHIVGKETIAVLPEVFKTIITKLYFPKPMRWGYGDFRFARPIHWLTAVFGKQIVPFEFEGVVAGNITRGHRVLGSSEIVLAAADDYEAALEKNFVIADQAKRRDMIKEQINNVAAEIGGQVADDAELLEEVTFILEYPTALVGNFDEKYLDIPKELVITPMREHQRYFPVYNADGGLLPKFITVRNGDAYGLDIVAAGNEKVLRARLADAEFFWKEDLQNPLEGNNDRLKAIVFHEKIGSVYEKVERIQKLSAFIAEKLEYDEKQKAQTAEAASLCKADLVTKAVYEFTELQGIMGEYYALAENRDAQVAQALREHYMPVNAGGELPETACGTAVALADKLDSLCCFFAMDMIPSGSQDPYALRRAAAGFVRIIIENGLKLPLLPCYEYAFSLVAEAAPDLQFDSKVAADKLLQFMKQRLEKCLQDEGMAYDVINAVFAVESDDFTDISLRAKAIAQFRQDDNFAALLAGFRRAANLLKNAVAKKEIEANAQILFNEAVLKEDEEKALVVAIDSVEGDISQAIADKDYMQALKLAGDLRGAIDNFFNGIMVMCDDRELKLNRLAILQGIIALTAGIGDLACLVE